LSSATGFTCSILLQAISTHYSLLYAEEERTATIKILPMKQRKIENRNQTNGKYGMGHDVRGLMPDQINVYRDDKDIVTLTLETDS